MTVCTLCNSDTRFTRLEGPGGRIYQCCGSCRLIFMEERFLPTREEEEQRYRMHENGREHPGYVAFLNQAIEPSLPLLKRGMRGLDYGCGPVPTLRVLLEERSMQCENYDPLFFPGLPEGSFDFIFSTECFEHFFSPARELCLIKMLLRPGGILTIMTEPWTTFEGFSAWYYGRDPTHVSFYHAHTIDWICNRYGFSRIPSGNERVNILRNLGEKRS